MEEDKHALGPIGVHFPSRSLTMNFFYVPWPLEWDMGPHPNGNCRNNVDTSALVVSNVGVLPAPASYPSCPLTLTLNLLTVLTGSLETGPICFLCTSTYHHFFSIQSRLHGPEIQPFLWKYSCFPRPFVQMSLGYCSTGRRKAGYKDYENRPTTWSCNCSISYRDWRRSK